jgi:TonB family protein
MRLASFLILSVSLHAAALLYPVSFMGRGQEQLLEVTILAETSDEGVGTPGNGRAGAAHAASSKVPRPLAHQSSEEKKSAQQKEPRPEPVEPLPSFDVGSAVLFSSRAKEPETNGGETANGADQNAVGFGGTNTEAGNGGLGGSGTGLDNGKDRGGTGLGENPAALTQVRYRDTPRPDYPDSARREGRQGSVLLRVLVDQQGRSKKIEINRSSGSEALDRAAAEAIKRWRFIPARHGDQPVESWIRIPIDFSLVDGNAR